MPDEPTHVEAVSDPIEVSIERSGAAKYNRAPYGYNYPYSSEKEEMHLRDMWRIVRKRKWMVISFTVIVTTVVGIEMIRARSIYQASTLVEIEKGTPTATKNGELIVRDNDLDSLKTKMLMVKSQPVLKDVVKSLRLPQDPRFTQKDGGRPVIPTLKKLIGLGPSGTAEETQEGDAADADANEPDERTLESYALILDKWLTVELVRDTRAVKIAYPHTDPNEAAVIANQVAKSFMDLSFKNQTAQFTDTSDWLDRSTRELKAKVEQAEQALADYTREHHIFSTDGKETLTTEKLSRLHDQLTRAQTDRLLKQTLYDELKAGHIAQLPESYLDAPLTALRSKLADLQIEAAELGVKYGPRNPHLLEVNQQIAITEQQIESGMHSLEQKIEGEYERAQADEKTLNAALDQMKAEAERENQDAIQFTILKQEVETAKGLYTDFLLKTNQANLQVAEQHLNMRVIQPALVPRIPVSPLRKTNVVIAFILSLGAGLGLTFFLEYLDNTIKSVEDITRYLQLPALGVIPVIGMSNQRHLKSKSNGNRLSLNGHSKPAHGNGTALAVTKPVVGLESHSAAAEAYRALRTSVLLSSAGRPPKTLLVTSAQPGEGKTTTAVNTAISLAQLGSEVLIIDADLRKPSVHKVFGADPSRGLSTYLSRDADVDGLIQKQLFPHLSVIASGPIPPNPAELISSERMQDLVNQLSERYDHIVIDSPPLINVTDPVILSTIVDGVMLVVSWGKSTRDACKRVRNELSSVGAKVFGVVLNSVDFRREGRDEYYYYRYYSDYSQGKDARA
jgi:capsular exopolysaccharide synthesis family protein